VGDGASSSLGIVCCVAWSVSLVCVQRHGCRCCFYVCYLDHLIV